jgi:hypothetical protein
MTEPPERQVPRVQKAPLGPKEPPEPRGWRVQKERLEPKDRQVQKAPAGLPG